MADKPLTPKQKAAIKAAAKMLRKDQQDGPGKTQERNAKALRAHRENKKGS